MANLIFHYQPIIHGVNSLVLHEAFSSRAGELYSVNPIPLEVKADTEEEMEEALRAMEVDSTKYKPVKYANITKELNRWIDEVEVSPTPEYEDEENLEDDYYGTDGEVLDLVSYMNRFKS